MCVVMDMGIFIGIGQVGVGLGVFLYFIEGSEVDFIVIGCKVDVLVVFCDWMLILFIFLVGKVCLVKFNYVFFYC